MKALLGALRRTGLTANPAKCQWGANSLGKSNNISIPEVRTNAIHDYKRPNTKKGLK